MKCSVVKFKMVILFSNYTRQMLLVISGEKMPRLLCVDSLRQGCVRDETIAGALHNLPLHPLLSVHANPLHGDTVKYSKGTFKARRDLKA